MIGFNPVVGDARITMMPVSVDASTHVVPARKSGEKPDSEAPSSFSAAARVATPFRV